MHKVYYGYGRGCMHFLVIHRNVRILDAHCHGNLPRPENAKYIVYT